MKYDNPRRATDEALAEAFGDIADELAMRGNDAWLLAFRATGGQALWDLLDQIVDLARLAASVPAADTQEG